MPGSQAQLLRQIAQISKREENKTCAECAQRDSCWAVIIHPPVRGAPELGIFCCGRCYKPHSLLGTKICVVKSLSMATTWTPEEVDIFEKSGNELVNAIYEAKLSVGERNSEKEIVTFDRQEEARVRMAYVTKKYQERKYFSQKEYGDKMRRIKSTDSSSGKYNMQEKADAARENRRAMLTGGSLSVRNLPSENSTASTSRTSAVLERAACQRRVEMRKCSSDRNLMGRLNGISLSRAPATIKTPSTTKSLLSERIQGNSSTEKSHKLHNLETSSAETAATENTDCSDDSGHMASQATSPLEKHPEPKPPQKPVPLPTEKVHQEDGMNNSRNNNKRPIRKTASLEQSLMAKTARDNYHKAPSIQSPVKRSASGNSLFSNIMGSPGDLGSNGQPSLFSTMKSSPSATSLFSAVMGTGGYGELEEEQKRPSFLGAAAISSSARSMFSAVMGAGGGEEEEEEEDASQSSSHNLMQLPCNLRVQKTPAATSGEGDPRLRKALSSRNLMSSSSSSGPSMRKVLSAHSLKPGEQAPRVRRALSARHPVSLNPPEPELLRSQSEDGSISNEESSSSLNLLAPTNNSNHLEAASAMGSMRGSFSTKQSLIDDGGSGHLEAASAMGSAKSSLLGSASLQQQNDASKMVAASTYGSAPNESPLQAFLQQKKMQTLPSGGNLTTGRGHTLKHSPPHSGARPRLGKSMSARNMNRSGRSAPRSTNSFSNVQNAAQNDSTNDTHSGGTSNWSAKNVPDNLSALGGGSAARKTARRKLPHASNHDAPLPIIKKSLSGRNLSAPSGNEAPKSAMRKSPSGKNLLSPTDSDASLIRKSLSGRNLLASVDHDASSRIARMHASFNALNTSGSFNFSPNASPNASLSNISPPTSPRSPSNSRRAPTRTISIESERSEKLTHSMRFEDIERQRQSVLCPSRRDLYDPDAEGLALLLQDSDPSMKDLNMDDSKPHHEPMRRQGSSRKLSPTKHSVVSPKTTKLPGEEESSLKDGGNMSPSPCSSSNKSRGTRDSSSQQSPRRTSQDKVDRTSIDYELEEKLPTNTRPAFKKSSSMRNPKSESRGVPPLHKSFSSRGLGSTHSSRGKSKRDSGHRSWEKSASSVDSSGRSSRDRRDKDRKDKADKESDRKPSRKSSRKDERQSSKDLRDDLESDNETKKSERSEERRRSKDSDRESKKSDRHRDKKSGDRERHDSKHRSSYSKEDRLEMKMERFIASVGDLNDEDFWIKMMNKWEESAQ